MPVGTPVDVVSSPSRINEAGQIDSDTTYAWSRTINIGVHADYHLEEPLESWGLGMFATRSFADDNTVLSASLFQLVDWFDYFNLDGKRYGRDVRTTTNVNLGVTQLLTPTTIVRRRIRLHDARGDADQHLEQRAPLRRDARHGDRPAADATDTRSRGGSSSGSPGRARSGSATGSTPTAGARSRTRWTSIFPNGWGGSRSTSAPATTGSRRSASSASCSTRPAPGFAPPTAIWPAFNARAVSAGARWDQPIGHRGHQIYFALTGERYVRSNDLHVDFVSGALGWQQ